MKDRIRYNGLLFAMCVSVALLESLSLSHQLVNFTFSPRK